MQEGCRRWAWSQPSRLLTTLSRAHNPHDTHSPPLPHAGTVVLGCALEGGLLLALFATAGVLEAQLAGSARGDLKALWASVPKTANAVVLLRDGSPDLSSLRVVAAGQMPVGSFCLVRAGEQVPLDGVQVRPHPAPRSPCCSPSHRHFD